MMKKLIHLTIVIHEHIFAAFLMSLTDKGTLWIIFFLCVNEITSSDSSFTGYNSVKRKKNCPWGHFLNLCGNPNCAAGVYSQHHLVRQVFRVAHHTVINLKLK